MREAEKISGQAIRHEGNAVKQLSVSLAPVAWYAILAAISLYHDQQSSPNTFQHSTTKHGFTPEGCSGFVTVTTRICLSEQINRHYLLQITAI